MKLNDHTKPDGTPKKQLDVRRLIELGWKAEIDLEEGIKKTIKTIEKDLKIIKVNRFDEYK